VCATPHDCASLHIAPHAERLQLARSIPSSGMEQYIVIKIIKGRGHREWQKNLAPGWLDRPKPDFVFERGTIKR